MPEEEQWPISDTWYYHDFHDGQKEYIQAMETRYGKSENLDDFCKKAQLLNYDSHRAMFESWNSKMWNHASGLLLWMSHPAWPSMVWQTYSWDYETGGSWFGARKACEPLHIQLNLHDRQVVILNTTLRKFAQLAAKLEIYDLKGTKLYSRSTTGNVSENRLTPCFMASFPPELPGVFLVRLTLSSGKQVLSQNDYWMSNDNGRFSDFNTAGQAKLTAKLVRKEDSHIVFRVTNASKATAIALKFNLNDKMTGRRILPALFSEGYLNLLPGEMKEISVSYLSAEGVSAVITGEGFNVADGELCP
jgi:hypothetical protein